MPRNDRFKRMSVTSTVALAAALCFPSGALALTQTFTINTSAVSGRGGRIVFDYVTSHPLQGVTVYINNFSAPGATIGLPTSTGGLIEGDLILGANPANSTTISTEYFGQGTGFNELSVNFTKFASTVTFQVQLPDFNTGNPPDEFALFVLDVNGNAWFSTADPLGANAIYIDDVVGSSGAQNIYAPAIATGPNTISLVLPPNGLTLNRTTLNFGATPNKATITSGQKINVLVPAGVAWTVASNQPFASVAPTGGTGNGSFTVSIVAGSLPASGPATATITVTAPGATNSPQMATVNFNYSSTNVPFGSFDTPTNGAFNLAGAIPVTGWSLDPIEITKVQIFREPVTGEPPNNLLFIGDAVLVSDARPDVAAGYPNAPYNYRAGFGYLLLTNFLPNANGSFKLHAIATNSVGATLDLGTKSIGVNNAGAAKPFGTIDTPTQGGTANGTQFVNFGWALTQNPNIIPTDGHTILVQVDGQTLGNPVYNNYRADIATLFPGRMNSNGAIGYYIIDTTKYSNDVHTMDWIVTDNVMHADGIGSRYWNVFNGGTTTEPAEDAQASARASSDSSIDLGPSVKALELQQQIQAGVRVRRGYDLNSAPAPVIADQEGWLNVDVEEVTRIELQLGAVSGYSIVNDDAGPLPAGSSMKDGVFYWGLGPGFLGKYHLVFNRIDGSQVYVRVTVSPKSGAAM